jgi:carboxypeptidase Taq
MCIPKEEFVEAEELFSRSYDAWLKAKTENNYSIFEPYLKKVIEIVKKMYGYRDSDLPLYDQMLDDFEPGMRQASYDVFFDALKERLVPLIRKVTEAEQIDTSFLNQNYDIDGQKKFMDEIFISTDFFLNFYDIAQNEFESCFNCISYIADLADFNGDSDYANEIRDKFNALLDLEEE